MIPKNGETENTNRSRFFLFYLDIKPNTIGIVFTIAGITLNVLPMMLIAIIGKKLRPINRSTNNMKQTNT